MGAIPAYLLNKKEDVKGFKDCNKYTIHPNKTSKTYIKKDSKQKNVDSQTEIRRDNSKEIKKLFMIK